MSMFEQIGDLLSAGDAPDLLANSLGTDSSTAMSGAASVIPALLGSTAQRSSTKGGAAALFDLVKDNDGSVLDNLGGLFGADHSDAEGPSNMLVDGLLGGSKSSIIDGLAGQSGVGAGMISKLLPMLAPMVMGFLGKRQSAAGLDATGLAGELGGEWSAMENAGMGETLGLLGNATAEDDANFGSKLGKLAGIGGLAGIAGLGAAGLAGKASGVAGSATGAVTGAAGSATGAATGAVSGATGKVTGAAGAMKGKAAGVTAAPQPTGKEKKGGLMKWLPLLLIIPLIALLAWACSNNDDNDDGDAGAVDTTEAATTTEAEPEPTTTEAPATTEAVEEEPEPEPEPEGWIEGNLMDTMDQNGNLNTLVSVVGASGAGAILEAPGPFTVFAPSDEALAELPDAITGDPAVLQRVLAYHVVSGNVTAADLVDGPVTTLDGTDVNIAGADSAPTVNGISVIEADLVANNGVAHIIDGVLLPADLQALLGGSLNEALGLAPINFEVNSAVITADSTSTLDQAAEFLIANNTVVEIAGHTDSDGDDAFNQQLSQDRADAVLAYLENAGVPAENMTAVGYGEAQPVAENDTPENKALNRRIEFVSAAS